MKDVSKCEFENGIVPYMYGELPTREATEFESHLLECVACTDEFAAVSAARYEVYEWKKLEFEPLATPVIKLPEMEPVGVTASWFDKLRAAFASSWAIPTVAFAALAIAFGLTVLFISSANKDDRAVAQNINSRVPVKQIGESRTPPATVAKEEPEPERNVTSEPRVVKASETRQAQPKRSPHADRVIAPKVVSNPTTATRKAPRLNEFEEEEDNSLRLAELFEDIDTRE